MKTVTLLCIAAALALAADQDQDKKAPDQKTVPKTAPKAAPKAAATSKNTAVPRAKRNLNRPTVTPVAPKLTPEQKAAAALPTMPQGAEEVSPNLYRYTDAQGKRWMYNRTPFGISKWEDKPGDQPPPPKPPPASAITVTDLGDRVQFQRMMPLGPQTWTRKKSELTEDEKTALAEAGAKSADAGKLSEKQ